jgi:hypothetical protein
MAGASRMKIMGGNILNRALSRVGYETITYYKFTGRTLNSAGIMVAAYAPGRCLTGSVQAVSHNLMQILGLDLNKDYVQLYTQGSVEDLERNTSPDQFTYGGSRYEIINDTDWKLPQGFVGSIGVKIS